MLSKWFELKESAVTLRQSGQSIKTIHRNLGIPMSTLSGWLKNVELTDEHKLRLRNAQATSLKNARLKAADWHRAQKALRLLKAKQEAKSTLDQIELADPTLDLALAMLYFGRGTKTNNSATIASSDPMILQLVLAILQRNYAIKPETISCNLHVRVDQDISVVKAYWSRKLGIPLQQFKNVAVDKRSVGKATYDQYKGVCVLNCGHVAIQRKLMYLYKSFCEKVIDEMGD